MFDSSYGMFMVNDDSRLCWFVNDQINDPDTMQEYNLIGRLIGLAIYNGVILDIHFPLALYKKIFGYPMTLDDLKEIDPVSVEGLNGTRESVLCSLLLFLVIHFIYNIRCLPGG